MIRRKGGGEKKKKREKRKREETQNLFLLPLLFAVTMSSDERPLQRWPNDQPFPECRAKDQRVPLRDSIVDNRNRTDGGCVETKNDTDKATESIDERECIRVLRTLWSMKLDITRDPAKRQEDIQTLRIYTEHIVAQMDLWSRRNRGCYEQMKLWPRFVEASSWMQDILIEMDTARIQEKRQLEEQIRRAKSHTWGIALVALVGWTACLLYKKR